MRNVQAEYDIEPYVKTYTKCKKNYFCVLFFLNNVKNNLQLSGRQICSHSATVENLLGAPRQPPYVNVSQLRDTKL